MRALHHLAQAAAIVLIVELIFVLLIILAISGGLAFGFRWVRKKEATAFDYADRYTKLGADYVHRGTDYAALPFLKAGHLTGRVEGTLKALQVRVRQSRQSGAVSPTVGSTPPPPADPATTPEPQATPPSE